MQPNLASASTTPVLPCSKSSTQSESNQSVNNTTTTTTHTSSKTTNGLASNINSNNIGSSAINSNSSSSSKYEENFRVVKITNLPSRSQSEFQFFFSYKTWTPINYIYF